MPKTIKPCGTIAAYRRHLRNSEQPCEACRLEWARYNRELWQGRKVLKR
jgi:hypothetical protein